MKKSRPLFWEVHLKNSRLMRKLSSLDMLYMQVSIPLLTWPAVLLLLQIKKESKPKTKPLLRRTGEL